MAADVAAALPVTDDSPADSRDAPLLAAEATPLVAAVVPFAEPLAAEPEAAAAALFALLAAAECAPEEVLCALAEPVAVAVAVSPAAMTEVVPRTLLAALGALLLTLAEHDPA